MVEFRKLISFGKTSFVMSIPKSWVTKNNLKKGDLVALDEEDGKLILSSEINKDREVVKKGRLDLTSLPVLKRRLICASYLRGYDELDVTYDKPEYIQVIQGVLTEFTGYDIVKQGKHSCTIKQISKPTEKEFDSVFNRLFLVIHDTGNFLVDSLTKNDKEALKSMPYREVSINKFANFCRRIINKKGYSDVDKISSIYFIISSLEFLGDEYKELVLHFIDMKGKINKEIINIVDEINKMFNGVYKLYFNYKLEKAVENAQLHDKLVKDIEVLFKNKKEDFKTYHHFERIIQIIIQMQEAILLVNV